MSRDRALVLTPRLPWPLDDGGRIVLWQSLWGASRCYETTLVSLVTPAEALEPVPAAIQALGVEVVRVPRTPPWMPVSLVRGVLGRWPYTLARYRNREFDSTLRRLVAERRPVLAIINHLNLATYLDALEGVAVVLREHGLEHLWFTRYAERLSNPLTRAYVKLQASRVRQAEAEVSARCDMVLAIREEEAEGLRQIAPSARVEVIPIGIDMARYLPRAVGDPPILALIASWDWPPNADGGRQFIQHGWPRVRSRVPGVRLRIVGKHLSRALAELARAAGAEVIGYVDDMAPEFARASAMVVPLWMGAGARVKIVEALAARVPVVTTTLGAEGLRLEPGVHALFAETPESLGDAVASLLEQPVLAHALADAGHALAVRHYSLEEVTRRTSELCAAVVARRAGTVG